jgi:hypothetical protein
VQIISSAISHVTNGAEFFPEPSVKESVVANFDSLLCAKVARLVIARITIANALFISGLQKSGRCASSRPRFPAVLFPTFDRESLLSAGDGTSFPGPVPFASHPRFFPAVI